MTIRKILAALLALSMTLSLAACGGNSTQTGTTQSEQTEESSSVSDESASDETTAENTETETPADETEASEPAEKVDINLAALSGPTALGMLDLLEKNDNGEAANNYNVTIATAPDEVTGKIISGELDIAAVPTNVASTLYNKTEGQVQIAALNKRLADKQLTCELTPAAKTFVIDAAYDPQFGARPLRRYLQHTVETLLAQRILRGDVLPGQTLVCDVQNSELVITAK